MGDETDFDTALEAAAARLPGGGELWRVAVQWVWTCLTVFGAPAAIAREGLTRRVGLRLRGWLWSIEMIVRRRLIAAALRLAIVPLQPAAASGDGAAALTARPPVRRAVAFHVYRFRAAQASRHAGRIMSATAASRPAPVLRRYFGQDALLRLGPAPRSARRAPHPPSPRLTRAMARMYGLDNLDEEAARSNRYWFGDRAAPAAAPSSHSTATRGAGRLRTAIDSPAPWLVDLDNRQLVPEPALGRRLLALHRVVEDPMATVRRLARALHRRGPLAAAMTGASPPRPLRPRVFDPPDPPLDDERAGSHRALVSVLHDTS